MKYDNPKIKRQFLGIEMCPYMFWKAMHMDAYCQKELDIELTITSIYRYDGSSHDNKPFRAVDFRVRHPETGIRTIIPEQVRKVKKYHDNNVKKYGPYDSFFEHEVFAVSDCRHCVGTGKKDNKPCFECEGTGKWKNSRGPHIHSQRPSDLRIRMR